MSIIEITEDQKLDMKKLYALLSVLLLLLCGYIWKFQNKVDEIKAQEAALAAENSRLNDSLTKAEERLRVSEEEAQALLASQQPYIEDYSIWHQRNERLQEELPH